MSNTQIWFRTQFPNQRPTKWHAATQVHEFAGAVAACSAPCGFESAPPHMETQTLFDGDLPVSQHETDRAGVCLHCQRALEMARREDDVE